MLDVFITKVLIGGVAKWKAFEHSAVINFVSLFVNLFHSVPTTSPTTLTTPEAPVYCQDQRVLNYNDTLTENFVVLGNDMFGRLTEDADEAMKGSTSSDGYGLNSYDGSIKILIKLTEICVSAEVVRFSFNLKGAANYTVRIGLNIPIYVSQLPLLNKSPHIALVDFQLMCRLLALNKILKHGSIQFIEPRVFYFGSIHC